MSKDLKCIENYLEKLAGGDYNFNIDEAILRKNNSAGKMARLVKIVTDKERTRAEAIANLAEGRFEKCAMSGSTDAILVSACSIASTLKGIISQLGVVAEGINSGNIDTRFDENSLKGDYRQIALALNEFLDAVVVPVRDVNNIIRSMSLNDFTLRVENTYSGMFEELTSGINGLCDRLSDIETRLVQISEGDFKSIEGVSPLSENDKLTPAFLKISNTMKSLADEINVMTEKCSNGKILEIKGSTEQFDGGYKQIIVEINRMFEQIQYAMSECLKVLSTMAVNNFEVRFGVSFGGDFAKMTEAIDKVRSNMLLTESVAKKIADGDISEIDRYKSIGKLSENDVLTPSLIAMMDNIQNLIDESAKMAKAAADGDLLHRINTENVRGEFVNMLTAFNNAFESMAEPIIEMSAILEGLVVGDTKTFVTGDYNGVFGALKNDVNSIIQQNQDIVKLITDVLNQIAGGNLAVEKVKDLQGDWNGIPVALNNILDSLNSLVGNIYNAVDEVAAGANQVSTASQELSQGATEQASSIEQLTASIAEIASQTKLNAKNAGTASVLAKSMRESAISGNKEMNEMLTSMQEINESSRSISKIIKVIDDIAFQTNLLALNAAVEAARAGQHGKGFAVVAEEVRNLAARSANAAKDTTALIEGSIKRVEKGSQIASNTAKTLGNIVNGVDKVAGLIEKIAVASNEQATGITQINQGLEQVSKVVQTNSATAEESAAASEELSGQASQLRGDVEKFTLRDTVRSGFSAASNKPKRMAAADSLDDVKRISLSDDFGKY